MGIDYFKIQDNTNEIIENKGVFFTRISRQKLSKKNRFSKDKNNERKK